MRRIEVLFLNDVVDVSFIRIDFHEKLSSVFLCFFADRLFIDESFGELLAVNTFWFFHKTNEFVISF